MPKPKKKFRFEKDVPPPDLTPAAELVAGTSESQEPIQGIDPIKFEQSMLNIHIDELGSGVCICRLKDSAPPEVVVKSGYYIDGMRIFNRGTQPFRVTQKEFETILDRGQRHFEKVGS